MSSTLGEARPRFADNDAAPINMYVGGRCAKSVPADAGSTTDHLAHCVYERPLRTDPGRLERQVHNGAKYRAKQKTRRGAPGKAVMCIETGERFHSAMAASLSKGVAACAVASSISRGCRSGGFRWRRLTPEEAIAFVASSLRPSVAASPSNP